MGQIASYLLHLFVKIVSYLLQFFMQFRSYSFFFVIYLLNFIVMLRLHVLFLLTPLHFPLVLPLLLVFQILLQFVNLINEALLIPLLGLCVLFDGDADLNDMLLQLDSVVLRVLEITASVLHIQQMIIDNGGFEVEGCDSSLQTLDLDFLLRHLHRHLVLLVIEHVHVVGRGYRGRRSGEL